MVGQFRMKLKEGTKSFLKSHAFSEPVSSIIIDVADVWSIMMISTIMNAYPFYHQIIISFWFDGGIKNRGQDSGLCASKNRRIPEIPPLFQLNRVHEVRFQAYSHIQHPIHRFEKLQRNFLGPLTSSERSKSGEPQQKDLAQQWKKPNLRDRFIRFNLIKGKTLKIDAGWCLWAGPA